VTDKQYPWFMAVDIVLLINRVKIMEFIVEDKVSVD